MQGRRAGVGAPAVVHVAGEEHEAAVCVPDVGEAGLGVKIFSCVPIHKMPKGRAVEAVPLKGALGPVPRLVLLGAEGKDLGGGSKPEGVDEMERGLGLVVLDGGFAEAGAWCVFGLAH